MLLLVNSKVAEVTSLIIEIRQEMNTFYVRHRDKGLQFSFTDKEIN